MCHTSRTVTVKCQYGNKYHSFRPVVPIFFPLPCKWGLSSFYLIVSISERIFCDNAFSGFPVHLKRLFSPILFSLRGSRRDCIGNILTFILIFTINVFHCFLKIHSQNDSILLPVDLLLSCSSYFLHLFNILFQSNWAIYLFPACFCPLVSVQSLSFHPTKTVPVPRMPNLCIHRIHPFCLTLCGYPQS